MEPQGPIYAVVLFQLRILPCSSPRESYQHPSLLASQHKFKKKDSVANLNAHQNKIDDSRAPVELMEKTNMIWTSLGMDIYTASQGFQ